jgi:hypothetical protein
VPRALPDNNPSEIWTKVKSAPEKEGLKLAYEELHAMREERASRKRFLTGCPLFADSENKSPA